MRKTPQLGKGDVDCDKDRTWTVLASRDICPPFPCTATLVLKNNPGQIRPHTPCQLSKATALNMACAHSTDIQTTPGATSTTNLYTAPAESSGLAAPTMTTPTALTVPYPPILGKMIKPPLNDHTTAGVPAPQHATHVTIKPRQMSLTDDGQPYNPISVAPMTQPQMLPPKRTHRRSWSHRGHDPKQHTLKQAKLRLYQTYTIAPMVSTASPPEDAQDMRAANTTQPPEHGDTGRNEAALALPGTAAGHHPEEPRHGISPCTSLHSLLCTPPRSEEYPQLDVPRRTPNPTRGTNTNTPTSGTTTPHPNGIQLPLFAECTNNHLKRCRLESEENVHVHATPAGEEQNTQNPNQCLPWNCRNRRNQLPITRPSTRPQYQRLDNTVQSTEIPQTRQKRCTRTSEIHRVHHTAPGRRSLLIRRLWQHTEPAKTVIDAWLRSTHACKYMTLHGKPQSHVEVRTQRLFRQKTLRTMHDESLGRLCPNFVKVDKREKNRRRPRRGKTRPHRKKVKSRYHVPSFDIPFIKAAKPLTPLSNTYAAKQVLPFIHLLVHTLGADMAVPQCPRGLPAGASVTLRRASACYGGTAIDKYCREALWLAPDYRLSNRQRKRVMATTILLSPTMINGARMRRHLISVSVQEFSGTANKSQTRRPMLVGPTELDTQTRARRRKTDIHHPQKTHNARYQDPGTYLTQVYDSVQQESMIPSPAATSTQNHPDTSHPRMGDSEVGLEKLYGGGPGLDDRFVPTAHLYAHYAATVITCATTMDDWNTDQYKSISMAEFSALTYRLQLDEFRKLDLHFNTESDLVRLLVPPDPNLKALLAPYTLPCVLTEMQPQVLLRHISHLESRLQKLKELRKQTVKETRRLLHGARHLPAANDVRAEYSKQQLLQILTIHKACTANKAILVTLQQQKRRWMSKFKKTPPRSYFVPHYVSGEAPQLSPIDPLLSIDDVARQLLGDWTPALRGKPAVRERQPRRRPTTPMIVLKAFVTAIADQPEPIVPKLPSDWDTCGGYKKGTQIFTEDMATLIVSTLNINGLTEAKLDMVTQWMHARNISVCILVDTRLTNRQIIYLGQRARTRLGPGTRVHCSKLKAAVRNRRQATHRVGGIMYIVAPAWGPSLVTCQDEYSDCGTLSSITLESTKERICIMGTYWPLRHALEGATVEEQNLWSRLAEHIHSRGLRESPVDYLKRLICTWTNTAVIAGARAVILGGDLNATWLATEAGGQRVLEQWATDAGFANGPRMLATHRGDTHVTRPGKEGTAGTWIDHLLHAGDAHHIDPIASFTCTGAEWTDVSDHRPLWTMYQTGSPITPIPTSARKVKNRPELELADKRVVDDYADAMTKYIMRRPPDLTTSESASASLLELQNISPVVTQQINLNYGKGKARPDMKDGWSPAYMAYKLYMITVIEIRRRLTGAKGRRRWVSWEEARTGIDWLLLQLDTNTTCLDIKAKALKTLYSTTACGPDWWKALDRIPIVSECDALIAVLRHLMQGRQRTDLRKDMNEKVAYREHMRQLGKMKIVLKSVLGVLGARKHQPTLNLDVVRNEAGTMAVTPVEVHAMVTEHFRQWYADQANAVPMHTEEDWKTSLSSLEKFQTDVAHTGVPTWASEVIYDAITNMPDRAETEAELAVLFASPPSYEEFCKAIKHGKNGSAPGMSGLSYNMIKAWPASCKQAAYDCLERQWKDKHYCPSWKWRWLVPIPKKFNDLTLLKDLRPLMLIETLRKLWTHLIMDKIQQVWRSRGTQNKAQHGCQAGMGTSTATILHIDSVEAAEELRQELHRSSWDKSRAFDSVSKNLMRIAWYRHGVPADIIKYLVDMDIEGPTVARTPHAAAAWDDLPYKCVDTPHQPTPGLPDLVMQLLDSFVAARGTGQGDVTSPPCWNAIFDILLTALQRDEIAHGYTRLLRGADQSHYIATETAYVDDLESCSVNAEGIQRKADIVSAFCLITGISISMDKLRRVLHDWKGKRSTAEAPDMFIHTYNWEPHPIRAATERSADSTTKYLGVPYDADNSGKTAMAQLLGTARLHCQTVAHTKASDTTKLEVVASSTMAKERYTGKLSNLTLSQYRRVDKVFNNFLTTTTKNMRGFPADLLYLSWKFGGLDIMRFSDAVQFDKYQIILSSLLARGPQRHAVEAHLNRAARSMQVSLLEGQGITLEHTGTKKLHRWVDSLLEWLAESGVHISRKGVRATALGCDQPIVDFLPRDNLLSARRRILGRYGLHVINDLDYSDTLEWVLPRDLEWVREFLPAPTTENTRTALRIGQFWRRPFSYSQESHLIHEIVSWTAEEVTVYQWNKLKWNKPSRYVQESTTRRLTYDDLFPTYSENLHTLVSMLRKKTFGDACYPRNRPGPHTEPLPTPPSQPWVTWAQSLARSFPDYSAALYTDGAWKAHHTIESILQPKRLNTTSSAAVIIKDASPQWKVKPVIVLHVSEGEDIGAKAAFSMEFLALAAAMTVADGLSAKPVVSDAESVLELLPGRKKELSNTRKSHQIPLQAIDRLLDEGAPMPLHVYSHPETEKPNKSTWTQDDWGNFMADRAAAQDWAAFAKEGLKVIRSTIPAGQLLEDLIAPGQWYLSDRQGSPISLEGVRSGIQTHRFREYITTRDGYRAGRGAEEKWKHNTIEFAAQATNMKHITTAQRAVVVRRLWDKGWHGGNRSKDPRFVVGTPEQSLAAACDLCAETDSADHWMHRCQHGPTAAVRCQTIEDLNVLVQECRGTTAGPVAVAFQRILLETDEPARMWTGNFNPAQVDALVAVYPGVLTDESETLIKSTLFKLLNVLQSGAAVMWFAKNQHIGPPALPIISTIPPKDATAAMLNPVANLSAKPRRRSRAGRKKKPLREMAVRTKAISVKKIITAKNFIGPVQPRRRLLLPCPEPHIVESLNRALVHGEAMDLVPNCALELRLESMYTLRPQEWLDDVIIHAYLELLQKRNTKVAYVNIAVSKALPPATPNFDYALVRDMHPELDMFAKDLILMPIHARSNHWTLLAMDLRRKRIAYYDSLRGDGTIYVASAKALLQAKAGDMEQPIDIDEWDIYPNAAEEFPAQPNGYDCGLYALMVADMLSQRLPVDLLSLTVMACARRHILTSLWAGAAPDLTLHTTIVRSQPPTVHPPAFTQQSIQTRPNTPGRMNCADDGGQRTRTNGSGLDSCAMEDQETSRPVTTDLTNANDADMSPDTVRLPDGSSIYKSAMNEALQGGRLTGAIVNSYLKTLCRRNGGVSCDYVSSETFRAFEEYSSHGGYVSDATTLRYIRRRAHLMDSDLVFMPVVGNNHWSLVTADRRTGEIIHEDPASQYHGSTAVYAEMLRDLLQDLHIHVHGTPDPTQWGCKVAQPCEVAQQTGTTACGVFICAYATMRQQDRTILEYHMDRDKAMRKHIVDCLMHAAWPNFPPVPGRAPVLTQQTMVCTTGPDPLNPETKTHAGNPTNTRPSTTQVRQSIGRRDVDVVTATAAGALSRAADLASRLATAKIRNTSMKLIAATVTAPLAEHNDARQFKITTMSTPPRPKDSPGATPAAHHGERGTGKKRKPSSLTSLVPAVTNKRRVAAHPPPRATLSVAGREQQVATTLVPADIPKQCTDTMMDHTGRQDSWMDVQPQEQAIQDASWIRSIGQGPYAPLTGFTGRLDEERKIEIYPTAKNDVVIGQKDAHQVAEMYHAPEHKLLLADSGHSILQTGDKSATHHPDGGHAGPTFTLTAISDNHTSTGQVQLTSIWKTTSARTLLMNGVPPLTPTKSETPKLDDRTGVLLAPATPHPTAPINTTDKEMKQLIITSLWEPLPAPPLQKEKIESCIAVLEQAGRSTALAMGGEPRTDTNSRPKRTTRNLFARYDLPAPTRLRANQLRHLHNLPADPCKLALGPSQQYTGGTELYLDQRDCEVGTILTYYTGTRITPAERDKSESRYIFEVPSGSNPVTGSQTFSLIDASDPDSGYGRYSDDSLYDGSENAHWTPISVDGTIRLALVATKRIVRGMPIRAPYGWEYWFQPLHFPPELMRKAFEGYLGHIAEDSRYADAWKFACTVECEQVLLEAWEGVRKHELPSPDSQDTDGAATSPQRSIQVCTDPQLNIVQIPGMPTHVEAGVQLLKTRPHKRLKTEGSGDMRLHFGPLPDNPPNLNNRKRPHKRQAAAAKLAEKSPPPKKLKTKKSDTAPAGIIDRKRKRAVTGAARSSQQSSCLTNVNASCVLNYVRVDSPNVTDIATSRDDPPSLLLEQVAPLLLSGEVEVFWTDTLLAPTVYDPLRSTSVPTLPPQTQHSAELGTTSVSTPLRDR